MSRRLTVESVNYNGAWYTDDRQTDDDDVMPQTLCDLTTPACSKMVPSGHQAGWLSHDPTAVVAVLVAALEP